MQVGLGLGATCRLGLAEVRLHAGRVRVRVREGLSGYMQVRLGLGRGCQATCR